jgi:release factor glutamine methyltransferase
MSERPAIIFEANESAQHALNALRRRLSGRDAANAALDARCLVEEACGLDRAGLIAHSDRPLGEEGAGKLAKLASRRLAGEPLGRILGTREFWGLPFELSPATLEPRPETETLVAAVLRHCEETFGRAHPWRILDLGTGTGCIALSLLSELAQASAVGIDRSHAALRQARDNAERLGLAPRASWLVSDWGKAIRGLFDVVVSNPPYIASADIAGLATEVRDHDPRLALDGGPDGLDCHRDIVNDIVRLMGKRARVFLEIGARQEAKLQSLLEQHGLEQIRQYRDLGGLIRVISGEIA